MMETRNIKWQKTTVTKEMREKKNGQKAFVLWLTGLPCSGKSTIANRLQKHLFEKGCQVFVLDGDNVRHGLNSDLSFTPEDRAENIRRIGEVAKLFVEAGFIVITAFISPYRKDRQRVRKLFKKGEFIEVYMQADVAVCERRDVKGFYKKARQGRIKDFTGISHPYEPPQKCELVIPTDRQSIDQSVETVLNYLKERVGVL